MRASIAAGLAILVGGCLPREPSETEMLAALQRYHQDWVAEQRRQIPAGSARMVDLPFEAGLALQIRSVRKETCAPASEAMGYLCTIEVEASTPFVTSLRRRMEARFVEGNGGWVAVMPRSGERAAARKG